MELASVTPLILTYNESANLRRTLAALPWARRVVIIDSYSIDDTLTIAAEFANVEVIERKFDNHTSQWNFGLGAIATPWVLTLDADYVCPAELTAELLELKRIILSTSQGFAIVC